MRRSSRQRAFWRLSWVGPFAFVGICHAFLLSTLLAPLTHAGPPDLRQATLAEDGVALEPLEASCVGDALLAAGAAAVACQSPLADRDCAAAVQAALAIDLARCHADTAPLEFAMLDPAQVAKLVPIDPEPLLDSITPEAQAAFEATQEAAQVALAEEAARQRQLVPEEAQVVETARPALEIAPDQARFVSEYNTKVAQETVARGAVREQMTEKPAAAELADPDQRARPDQRPAADRSAAEHGGERARRAW